MPADRLRPQDVVSRRLPKLVEVIDPKVILPHLPCISSARKETIWCQQTLYGKRLAVQSLMEYLRGRDNWFTQLCDALRHPEVNLPGTADMLEADLEGRSHRGANMKRHRHVNKDTPVRLLTGELHKAFKRLDLDTLENWKIFAEKAGYSMDEINQFENEQSPSLALLRDWVTKDDATLGILVQRLSDMERDDILTDLEEGTAAKKFVRRYRARPQSGGVKSTAIARTHGCKRPPESVRDRVDSRHPRKLSEGRRPSGVSSRRHPATSNDKSRKVTQPITRTHSSNTGGQPQNTNTQERFSTLDKENERLGFTDSERELSSLLTQASAYKNVSSFGSDTEESISEHVDDRFESQSVAVISTQDDALSSVRYREANVGLKHSKRSSTGFDSNNIQIQKLLTQHRAEKNPAQTYQDVGVKEMRKSSGDVEEIRHETDKVIGAPVVLQPCVDSAFFKNKRQFIDEIEQKFSDSAIKSFHSQYIRPQGALGTKTRVSENFEGVPGIPLPKIGNAGSSSFVDIQYIRSPSTDLNKGPITYESTNSTDVKEISTLRVVNNIDTAPKEAFCPRILDSSKQLMKEFGRNTSQASVFFDSEASTVVTNMETSQTNEITGACDQSLSSPSISSANTDGRSSVIRPRAYCADTDAERNKVIQGNSCSLPSSTFGTKYFGDDFYRDSSTDVEPSVVPNNSHETIRPCDRDLPDEKLLSHDFPATYQRCEVPGEEIVCGSNNIRNGLLTIGAAVVGVLAIKVLQHV